MLRALALSLLRESVSEVATKSEALPHDFVRVAKSQFVVGQDDRPFYYIGSNFWQGMNLAAEKDQGRLARELDRLAAMGVRQLRILGASEGPDSAPWRVVPALMPEPGKYNEALLDGLDRLISEMGKRGMKATVTLNNNWQWSGGFAQHYAWSRGIDAADIPYPAKGGHSWDSFQEFARAFLYDAESNQRYREHITFLTSHENPYTGLKLRDDPSIMAWQIANEPRATAECNTTLSETFNAWIDETAAFIKAAAPKQLVSTGSEGDTPWGCNVGDSLVDNHNHSAVDYATAHVWPMNWDWYHPGAADIQAEFKAAMRKAKDYIELSIREAESINKPLVFEEFGFPRDGGSLNSKAGTKWRDEFYRTVLHYVVASAENASGVAGANFWAFAGEGVKHYDESQVPSSQPPNGTAIRACFDSEAARPDSCPEDVWWHAGDVLTGDPPHETQGWYSVYAHDASTIKVVHEHAEALRAATLVV